VRTYSRQLNGVAMIDDAKKALVMTEAQFTQCFELIERIYKSGTAAPASYMEPFGQRTQEDPNWIAGKYVAHVGYTSTAEVMQAANKSVQYFGGSLPLLANRKSDGWVNNCPQFMGVYAKTKYPEECGKFYNFFFNTEEAAKILGTVRTVPPTAMAQKVVKDAGILNPLVADVTARSLSYKGFDDAGYTTSAEPSKILLDAYNSIAHGRATPAQAAKNVVQQLNAFLARQK